ncbi:hypothetical protein [Brevundimonas sp. SORGH_AS_0993]|nr:hypothetical protein [Brevundimonas sp. SORGH_AS_0993]MDQ1153406.1 hypothetical protein [Brevundimonas sp. SORGH_AS_0993]
MAFATLEAPENEAWAEVWVEMSKQATGLALEVILAGPAGETAQP